MLQGINLDNLPLTFQHAILITRNLDYRYLWIDSLCIIQDDPSDWAFESGTMSRIYSNSVLTIAALWGNDSLSGCFVERNPLVTEDCCIGKWKYGDVFVRSNDRQRGQCLSLVQPSPLLQRAWVMQERFLSPRTLYYGPWELLWECNVRAASETQPESTGTFWAEGTLKKRFREMKGALESDFDNPFYKPGLKDTYDIWREIRAIYWSTQLTHHSDSLVAIAGIASRMEQSTSVHFVSGLCKEFLYSELLWKVGNPRETSRSTLCQTWSWASVKGARLRVSTTLGCTRTPLTFTFGPSPLRIHSIQEHLVTCLDYIYRDRSYAQPWNEISMATLQLIAVDYQTTATSQISLCQTELKFSVC